MIFDTWSNQGSPEQYSKYPTRLKHPFSAAAKIRPAGNLFSRMIRRSHRGLEISGALESQYVRIDASSLVGLGLSCSMCMNDLPVHFTSFTKPLMMRWPEFTVP